MAVAESSQDKIKDLLEQFHNDEVRAETLYLKYTLSLN